MPIFRIAQVSDLHFGHTTDHLNPIEAAAGEQAGLRRAIAVASAVGRAVGTNRLRLSLYPSTFCPDAAQGLLLRLEALLPELDALLVTGDLATTGEDTDLGLALDYFRGTIPATWNPVGGMPSLVPENVVVCLPGNHDRYQGLALSPGGGNFERRFGQFWDFDRDIAYEVRGSSPRVRVVGLQQSTAQLFLCFADFSLFDRSDAGGLANWIGQGRVTAGILEDLTQTTKILGRHASAAGREVAIVWAVHFPPAYPDIEPGLELIDSADLIREARACGVLAVLAGHTHKALHYEVTGNEAPSVKVYCCGSSTGYSDVDDFAFSVLEIEVDAGVRRLTPTNFVWDREQRSFEAAASFPTR